MKYVTGLVVDYVEDEGGPAFELSNAFSGDGGCREGRGACGCNKNKIH
jgi:Fe-S cluster assembly iron-binding protein IscA